MSSLTPVSSSSWATEHIVRCKVLLRRPSSLGHSYVGVQWPCSSFMADISRSLNIYTRRLAPAARCFNCFQSGAVSYNHAMNYLVHTLLF